MIKIRSNQLIRDVHEIMEHQNDSLYNYLSDQGEFMTEATEKVRVNKPPTIKFVKLKNTLRIHYCIKDDH